MLCFDIAEIDDGARCWWGGIALVFRGRRGSKIDGSTGTVHHVRWLHPPSLREEICAAVFSAAFATLFRLCSFCPISEGLDTQDITELQHRPSMEVSVISG
jgi:hypothetical protein